MSSFRIVTKGTEPSCLSVVDDSTMIFGPCTTYDPSQVWEKKEYEGAGTAFFTKTKQGKTVCLHSPCLLDRNKEACTNTEAFPTECSPLQGAPASLWSVEDSFNIVNHYDGQRYCLQSRVDGKPPIMSPCPDSGASFFDFEAGTVTQSTRPDAFMHSLYSSDGAFLGADMKMQTKKGTTPAPFAFVPPQTTPVLLWTSESNACMEIDVPSATGDGGKTFAALAPKIVTTESAATRAVGRPGTCRTLFYSGAENTIRTKILDEEFCLRPTTTNGEVRLVACDPQKDPAQKWDIRRTDVPFIDPPIAERPLGVVAPAPAPDLFSSYDGDSPSPDVAAASPATLEWLAGEKWFWPLVGVLAAIVLIAMAATAAYFFMK